MLIRRFEIILPLLDKESKHYLNTLTRPNYVDGQETPGNLNHISYGQLVELLSMKTDQDVIYTPCKTILGFDESRILKCDYREVIGFSNFCLSEAARIATLFESCNIEPTPDEINAGVKDLKFGVFGMLDWYARRMGISDHDEVLKLGWVRLFKASEMDSQRLLYDRRLKEILAKKR